MAIELLPGVDPYTVNALKLARKYRVCKLTGHLYYEVSRNEATGRTVVECRRCYPHKSSRRSGTLYDLFPTPE
jgi:hypothetical protein